MIDVLLDMSDAYATKTWIQYQYSPHDQDGILAVFQDFAHNMLVFANRREDLAPYGAPYPGPLWTGEGEIIHSPSESVKRAFILLNINDAPATVAYICRMVDSKNDVVVAARVADHQTITFGDHFSDFSGPVWSGFKEIAYAVTPGKNWMPPDSLYVQALAYLLDIPEYPEIVNSLVVALADPAAKNILLTRPGDFLQQAVVVQGLDIAPEAITALKDCIQVNLPMLQNIPVLTH